MSTPTHCPYCALQCATTLTATGGPAGTPPVAVSGRDFPTNRGGLCRKGWTAPAVLTAPDRLTTPLVRGDDGELHPATWDGALGLVAETVRALQQAHGRDAVAVFGGGGLTNEKAYALGTFAPASSTTSAAATSPTGNGRPRSTPNARLPAAAADDMQNRPL